MKELIMAKYGEIALKGENKNTFEVMLQKNIKRRLRRYGRFEYYRRQSTIYITPLDEVDMALVEKKLSHVFGIGAIQRCAVFPKDFEAVCAGAKEYLAEALESAATF